MDVKLMEKIRATSSRLEKEDLLKQAGPETVKFLKWAVDPIITFGVTADEQYHVEGNMSTGRFVPHLSWWEDFDSILRSLSLRKVTGNLALNVVRNLMIEAPSVQAVIWACRVLNKDLDCGIQITTLNKVFPGTIEPFACSLAREYDPDKHELDGNWIGDPKLDGLRMVVLDGIAYTRNGRTIDTVGHVLKDLSGYTNDWVFDGEIMGETEFNEDSGKIRKKGTGPNKSLVYNVFDVVRREQWLFKKTSPLVQRKVDLENMEIPSPYVRKVPWFDLKNGIMFKELEDLRDKFISQGFEGIMFKDKRSPYRFKRSDDVLKFKEFFDADGKVVGVQEGKKRHEGRLGALLVDFDGVITRVGSGFSDEQRTNLWSHPLEPVPNVLGRVVQVKYQNKTPDGKLRFPVFMKFRPDKE